MEYIQAIIFTSKYIFGTTGNTDLFYLFSAIVLLFYAWRRRDKFVFVLKVACPIVIICLIMALFYPNISVIRVVVFAAKMILNSTLLLFVAYNSRKWKLTKFVEAIVWIHAIETIVAFLLPNSGMWAYESFAAGTNNVARLKLFYSNAGSLSFACGFILILLVYQIITEEVVWHQVVGLIVLAFDIYLSYGIGGLTSALMAVVLLLYLAYINRFRKIETKRKKKFIFFTVASFILVVVVIISNAVYLSRTKSMLNGTDYILITKLLRPLSRIGDVLRKTHYLGVGFGNANTNYALNILDVNKAYPNSFLRLIAEGGLFGIALVFFVIISLAYISHKYGSIVDKALCVYVIVYQLAGGQFTDPANYFIYGLILGSCIRNQIIITGTTKLKIFMPVYKEKLHIAQIGHKRIPSREGGVEIVVEELSKRYVERNHSVDAYNRNGDHISGAQYNLAKVFANDGYKTIIVTSQMSGEEKCIKKSEGTIYRLDSYPMMNDRLPILKYTRWNQEVINELDNSQIDYIVINTKFYPLMYIASRYARKRKIPAIVIEHGTGHIIFSNKLVQMMGEIYEHISARMIYSNCNRFAGVSKACDEWLTHFRIKTTDVLYNAVDYEYIREQVSNHSNASKREELEIVYTGRLIREKGLEKLIRAFLELQKEYSNIKLNIVGNGPLYDELYSKSVNNSGIVMWGKLDFDDVIRVLSKSSIFVLTSDYPEGLPTSILEAMACGLYVITSNMKCAKEIICDPTQGYILKNNTSEEIVFAIKKYLNDIEFQNIVSINAMNRIRNEFTWQHTKRHLEKIFERIIHE